MENRVQKLKQKEKRRTIEYSLLVIVYFIFFLSAAEHVALSLSSIVAFIGTTAGWMLSHLREKRRCLSPFNRQRLIAEIVETLVLLSFLAFGGILALSAQFPTTLLFGYLSLLLWTYFLATLLNEIRWHSIFFPQLSEEKQQNYLQNLSPTIFFPLNLYRLKS